MGEKERTLKKLIRSNGQMIMINRFFTTNFKRNFMNTTFVKNKKNVEQLEWDSGQSRCELTNVGSGFEIMG